MRRIVKIFLDFLQQLPTLSADVSNELSPIVDKHIKILEARCGASVDMAILTGVIVTLAAAIFAGIVSGGPHGLIFGIGVGVPAEVGLVTGMVCLAEDLSIDSCGQYSLPTEMKKSVLELQEREQKLQRQSLYWPWVAQSS